MRDGPSSRAFPLALLVGGLIGLAVSVPRAPVLVWNATASAPIGLYLRRVKPALARGDLVLVKPPAWVASFAAKRGYLPLNVPLIKRAAALAGDTVCANGDTIWLNGKVLITRRATDAKGRLLPHWSACRKLARDDVFLAMVSVPDSFDSRYFGPISTTNIIGHLVPLWTR